MDHMIRHSLRSYISLLMVFAMLSMIMPRAAMALPMGMGEMMQSSAASHAQMQISHETSPLRGIARSVDRYGHQDMCQCAAPCCSCGVCHATVPVDSIYGFGDRFTVPPEAANLNLAEATVPLDPRPPRV